MCGPHFKLLVTSIPRSFSTWQGDNSLPYMQYGNRVGSCFLHIVSTLHFSVLNRMFESVLHFSSLARSSCRNWHLLQILSLCITLNHLHTVPSSYWVKHYREDHLWIWQRATVPECCLAVHPMLLETMQRLHPRWQLAAIYRSSSSRTIVKAFRLCLAFEACEVGCHDLQSRTLSRNLSIAHWLVCFGLDSYQYHVVHLEAGLYMNDLLRSHVGHYWSVHEQRGKCYWKRIFRELWKFLAEGKWDGNWSRVRHSLFCWWV
jgi:hypothetical protein